MYGEDDRTIPGNALTVAPNSPFRALQREGNAFLSRFEGSLCAAPLLEHLSLIDTPGVLSGEKQRVQRHYDFDVVVQWCRRSVVIDGVFMRPRRLDAVDAAARESRDGAVPTQVRGARRLNSVTF